MQKFEVDGRTFIYGRRAMVHGEIVIIMGPSIEFDNMVSYYQVDSRGNIVPGFPSTVSAKEIMPYGDGPCVDSARQCNHPFHGRHQIVISFGHFLKVGDQEHYCQYPYSCI